MGLTTDAADGDYMAAKTQCYSGGSGTGDLFLRSVIYGLTLFPFPERGYGLGRKLEQEVGHELGLQFEHVGLEATVRIAMAVDFKEERAFGSRELGLCIAQQLKENMRRLVEILVGENAVGDRYGSGWVAHVLAWPLYAVVHPGATFPLGTKARGGVAEERAKGRGKRGAGNRRSYMVAELHCFIGGQTVEG
jgi:hypothetical protein